MSEGDAARLALREALELAPFEAGQWREALARTSDLARFRLGMFVNWTPQTETLLVSTDEGEFIPHWLENRGDDAQVNPIIARGLRAGVGEPYVDAEVIDRDARRTSAFWQEVYERRDVPHVGVVVLDRGTGGRHAVLAAGRNRRLGPFEADDIRLMREIGATWRRAVLHAGVLGADADRLARGALEAAGSAAFLFDATGQVRAATPMAEDLLRTGIATLRAHRLALAADPDAVERALRACRATGRAQQVEIPCGPARTVRLTVGPLPDAASRLGFGPAMVGVCEVERRLPGLTAAETQVATALLAGHSLPAIAERRGVSLQTVKTQAKAIYAKADVGGQVAFVLEYGRRPRSR